MNNSEFGGVYMNTDMDIDINTVTDTITCRLVEARADLGIT